ASAAQAARSMGASGSVASTTSVSPGSRSAMRRLAIASGRGHARPRASTVVTLSIVNATSYRIAAVLASGEPERLYSGLSLLVSAAADGEPCAGLAAFRGLDLLLDDDLLARAENAAATPPLSWPGREAFARAAVGLGAPAPGPAPP